MENKKLESLLKDTENDDLIKIIEKCERGRVAEIKLTEEEGITNDTALDKEVLGYLRELKIKLVFVTEKEYYRGKNRYYKAAPKCSGGIHAVLDSKKQKKEKVTEITKEYQIMKIGNESYVTCPECWNILPILGYDNDRKERKEAKNG